MISITALTGGETAGGGMFDELMRTNKSHLEAEFESGRITGEEYSKLYLAALTAALSTAAQFILSYELTNQQILLAQEQVTQAVKQTALVTAQIAKLEAETIVTVKQATLMDEQILTAVQQTALTTQQVAKTVSDIAIGTKQLEVMTSQIAHSTAQTTMVTQQTVNVTNENTTITKQQNKIDTEITVLEQKAITEQAQTLDTVNGQALGGILGKQATLYTRQADGYTRDAEQKAAKLLIDTWQVQRSTDDTLAPYDAFNQTAISPVIAKLITGVTT